MGWISSLRIPITISLIKIVEYMERFPDSDWQAVFKGCVVRNPPECIVVPRLLSTIMSGGGSLGYNVVL